MRKPKADRRYPRKLGRNHHRALVLEQFEKRVVFSMAPLYDPIPVDGAVGGSISNDGAIVALAVDPTSPIGFTSREVLIEQEEEGNATVLNVTPSTGKLYNNAVKRVGDRWYGWLASRFGTDIKLSEWDQSGVSVAIEFSVPNATSLNVDEAFSGAAHRARGVIVDAQGVATVLATARFADDTTQSLVVRSDGMFVAAPAGMIELIECSDSGHVLIGAMDTESLAGYTELLVFDPSLGQVRTVFRKSADMRSITAAAISPDGKNIAFIASNAETHLTALYLVDVGQNSTPTRLIGSARDNKKDVTETSIALSPSFPALDIPFGSYFTSHGDIKPSVFISSIQDEAGRKEFFIGYETLYSTGNCVFRMTVTQETDNQGKLTYLVAAPDPVFIAQHSNSFGQVEGTEIEIDETKLRIRSASLLDMNANGDMITLVQGATEGQVKPKAFLIKTEFSRRPVLVVPGIVGSFPLDTSPFSSNFKEWIFNLGYDVEKLYLDPIASTYVPLVKALESAGYERNKDLFEAAYDWRLPPAPRDLVYDGRITFPEINQYLSNVMNGRFEYGVDYLVYWIQKAKTAWERENPGHKLDKVDVVAHSTGGLLTRAFAQSTIYDQPMGFNGDDKLPRIGSFVMAAVPNLGAPKALSFLNDNWWIDPADVVYPYLLRAIANTAFQAVLKGKTIQQGGVDKISLLTLIPAGQDPRAYVENYRKASQSDPEAAKFRRRFIDQYVAQIRGLVAYDAFIGDNGSFVTPASLRDEGFINVDLLDLNNGRDPTFLSDGAHAYFDFPIVVHGSGVETTVQQFKKIGVLGESVKKIMQMDQWSRQPMRMNPILNGSMQTRKKATHYSQEMVQFLVAL